MRNRLNDRWGRGVAEAPQTGFAGRFSGALLPPSLADRDPIVDGLRGLALVLMMFGHAAVSFVPPPWPLWGEMVGSLAPIFFFLIAGMMVTDSVTYRNRKLAHFLKRMALLMSLGAAIDLAIWRIWPFTSCEVLYAIGLYLPLTYLAVRHLGRWRLLLAAALVALTPILQNQLGYTPYPLEWGLDGQPVHSVAGQTSVWQHWLIDGWFPIFPWLGVMLLGSWLGEGKGKLTEKSLVLGPGCALLIGLGLWLWRPITPGLSLRLQVGGAFMPPQPGYLLWGAGMFLLCWVTTRPAAGAAGFVPLRVFGRYPLVGYGLHLAFIQLMRYRFGKFFFTRWQFFLILALWLGALYLLLVGIAHCTGWVRSNKRFCFQLKWLARLNAGAMVCRQVRKRESWP